MTITDHRQAALEYLRAQESDEIDPDDVSYIAARDVIDRYGVYETLMNLVDLTGDLAISKAKQGQDEDAIWFLKASRILELTVGAFEPERK